jgi:inhibitor of KinA sporulation pathway (predicted exonuclease)
MIMMSLDLEFNQPSGKIIEVGYVIGDIHTGVILERVSRLIQIDEKLHPRIISLTGITDEMLDENGISLEMAYAELAEKHKNSGCFRNAITWGGGDTESLRRELGASVDWVLGRRWLDAKTLFVTRCIVNQQRVQSGLAKSMTRMGMVFDGKKHRAMDDALNTFIIFRALAGSLKIPD